MKLLLNHKLNTDSLIQDGYIEELSIFIVSKCKTSFVKFLVCINNFRKAVIYPSWLD